MGTARGLRSQGVERQQTGEGRMGERGKPRMIRCKRPIVPGTCASIFFEVLQQLRVQEGWEHQTGDSET
jgi:hypothetical protein